MDNPFEQAKLAIDYTFAETTVASEVTRDRLEQLRERIDGCLVCLAEDEARAL